jgi:AmmeMemoRadiSam system protein A
MKTWSSPVFFILLAFSIEGWIFFSNGQAHIICQAAKIDLMIDSKTRVVDSSNSSHFPAHNDAVARDRETIFGDSTMQNHHKRGQELSEAQGKVLVKLARQTLMQRLGQQITKDETDTLNAALKDSCFQVHCATFVTLKINGQLRGCIGSLTATEPLSTGIRRNAINAAFHDPRFAPLSANELDQVEIEVSILTEPQLLEYQDDADLIKKLRPHIDGVIIRKGHASATFLPQVWEQLPEIKDFLAHLCMKAGLPQDAWQDPDLEISTYQVQYFEEH